MSAAASRTALLAVALASGRGPLLGAEPLARCEAAIRAAPADREAWRCFEVVGQARYDDVKSRLDARRAARPHDPRPLLALGRLEAGRGAERADALLVAAADGFARIGDDAGVAQALSARVRFLDFRRRASEARAAAESLRALAARTGVREVGLELSVVEAGLAKSARDYGRAWTLLRGAEEDVLAHGHSGLRRGWLSLFAYVGWATGRRDEALAAYRQLASLLDAEGDHFRRASVLTDQMSLMTSPGVASPDERRRTAQDALDTARESGNLAAESIALDYLAEFGGPGPAAASAVARALELARLSGDPRTLAMAQRATMLYGESGVAEEAFRDALGRAEREHDLDEKARTLVVRSRALWTTGPRAAAIAASTAAMDAAEATRDLQPDSLTRARRFAQWARPYMELAGHLLEGDLLPDGAGPSGEDVARAFTTLERMRARVLLDEMDASRTSADLFTAGPDGRRRDEVLKDLDRARQRLRTLAPSDPARGEAGASILRLEGEESALRRKLLDADTEFAALRHPSFPTLPEIQAGLGPDEALLVFSLADAPPSNGPTWGATSRVLVITRGSVTSHPVPDRLTLGSKIALYGELTDARRREEEAGSESLFDELLRAPVASLPRGIRRIVLVPDRELHSLPFASLRAHHGGLPFAELFELSVVPSATVWWRTRAQPPPHARRGVLAVVDPGSSPGAGSTERAGGTEILAPLALARSEGGAAVRRVGRASRLLEGSDAREDALGLAAPSDYRVLHFAAHAVLDDTHPEKSAIVLAAGRPPGDGLLHLREIAALKLPGSVVVVSGCRTAAGLVLGSEGPMGLARAFFQAGARTVVGSLRPLRDDEAAAFFDRFYAHLASGASVSGAVRLAQGDRRGAGAPAAAWAGIVTLGDGSAVPFPPSPWRWPLWAGALVLAAGVFAFVRARRVR